MKGALAYGERGFTLFEDCGDSGRRVSALVANLQHRAGHNDKARQIFDNAVALAEAHCSLATQRFAREEKESVFPLE